MQSWRGTKFPYRGVLGQHVQCPGTLARSISGGNGLEGQREGLLLSPMSWGSAQGWKGLSLAGARHESMCAPPGSKLPRPITRARNRLTRSGMGCAGVHDGLSRMSPIWAVEVEGWQRGGVGNGYIGGQCMGGGVAASNSEGENPPKAASLSWVGAGVEICGKEGVGEVDSYRWGEEDPTVFPMLGGCTRGFKGPSWPAEGLGAGGNQHSW